MDAHLVRRISVGTGVLVFSVMACSGGAQPALPAEALDGQVQAWRQVRASEDVPTNVQRLRAMGFSVSTVSGIMPSMMSIWNSEPWRDFGTLAPEAVAKVKAIDRDFAVRWREIALQAKRDVEVEGNSAQAKKDLEREWLATVKAALNEEEARVFGLLNSSTGLRLRDHLAGIEVTTDDKLALIVLIESFENRVAAGELSRTGFGTLAERMKMYRDMELILGPERFARYLPRAVQDFRDFNRTITELPGAEEDSGIKLWWIRGEHRTGLASLASIEADAQRAARKALNDRTKAQVEAAISPRTLAALELSPAGSWLPKTEEPPSFQRARKAEK